MQMCDKLVMQTWDDFRWIGECAEKYLAEYIDGSPALLCSVMQTCAAVQQFVSNSTHRNKMYVLWNFSKQNVCHLLWALWV